MATTDDLPSLLRARREQLGISIPHIARLTDMADSSYRRIEAGEVAVPSPERLSAIADTLQVPATDLFAAAGWIPEQDLPTLRPYLRTKYDLTPEAAADIEATFEALGKRYGIAFDRYHGGPKHGEDE